MLKIISYMILSLNKRSKRLYLDLMPKVLLAPMGCPFLFYQHFWDLIKGDLLAMFDAWNNMDLDLYRLNFSLLTLIPKEPDAVIRGQYL
jgi:hypothetical protein